MPVDHYENFPVASLLLPRALREPVEAIYAFARSADDIADEGDAAPVVRLARLNDYRRELLAIEQGKTPADPMFARLARNIRDFSLPVQLFRDLLDAFQQDVGKTRYADFAELLDYCRRSANPVGRLVLRIGGYRDEALDRSSDALCTGLQLANFWQDVEVDLRKDRIYLPLDEMDRFGVRVEDLQAKRFTREYASLMKFQVERTRDLFNRGAALPARVRGRLAVELRLTWLGGMRILERIEENGYDTLNSRPRITTTDKIRILLKSLAGL